MTNPPSTALYLHVCSEVPERDLPQGSDQSSRGLIDDEWGDSIGGWVITAVCTHRAGQGD